MRILGSLTCAITPDEPPGVPGGGRSEAPRSYPPNAAIPVCARPSISAWTSCVPS